jgi:hypothetical protein
LESRRARRLRRRRSDSSADARSADHVLRGFNDAADDAGHAVEVHVFGEIIGLVVVGIAQEGSVDDHQGGVADLPEGPLVGHVGTHDTAGRWEPEGREARVLFEAGLGAADETPGIEVAGEDDEVADAAAEAGDEADEALETRIGILLRAAVAVVAADGFEVDEAADVFVAGAAAASVAHRAHEVPLVVRRLLVDEEDEAEGALEALADELGGDFEDAGAFGITDADGFGEDFDVAAEAGGDFALGGGDLLEHHWGVWGLARVHDSPDFQYYSALHGENAQRFFGYDTRDGSAACQSMSIVERLGLCSTICF